MHLQARASTTGSAFADDHEESADAVSAAYPRGALSEILRVLEEAGLNLRSAGGPKIELGGEFAFAVADRDDNEPDGKATEDAVAALNDAGIDARIVEVQTRYLDDVPGALRAFVDAVRDQGLLVEEIAVGTPARDGRVPVQIYTARAGGSA
jgi:hypothetical protein